jgi:hypothetical protein
MFSKNAITIQLIASVPLQFSTCLKNAIMYAKHRIGPTCRRIGLEKDREMSFLPSSSTSVFLLPLNGLNTRRRQPQPPAAAQTARGGAARGSAHARRSSPAVELARGGTRARGRARAAAAPAHEADPPAHVAAPSPRRYPPTRAHRRGRWRTRRRTARRSAGTTPLPRRPNPRPPLCHLQIVAARTFHTS